MRNAILSAASAALALSLSSTALLAQDTAAPRPGVDLCGELVRFLETRGNAQPAAPVTLEDAQNFQRANDLVACRDGFVRVREAGITVPVAVVAEIDRPEGQGMAAADGTDIVVQQGAPAVTVEQAPPQVTVSQPQPQVTVAQPQPEIIVNQPAPVVTVDIPQPEIIVRMPEPEVNVSQAQPQVEVVQPQPQVQVVQQEEPQVQVEEGAQANVQVQRPIGQANVQVQQPEGQPQITYNRAEPQIIVNQAEGQPNLRVERLGEAGEQGVGTVDSQATAALGEMQRFTAGDLGGMEVISARGDRIGTVEAVVRSKVDNKAYAVIAHAGAMNLGDKRVTLSVEGLRVQGDTILVPVLTDQAIRDLPAFSSYEQEFPRIEGDAPIEIPRQS